VDAKRDRPRGAQFDEVFAFDVVYLDMPVKPTCEFRRDERFELFVAGASS